MSPALHTHTEAGDLARAVVLVFMVVALVVIFWGLRPARRGVDAPDRGVLGVILQVLLVLVSLAALVAVIRAGHTGAEVAWKDVIEQTKNLPSAGD